MAFLKRLRLGLSVVAMVAVTALLGCERGRPTASSPKETASDDTTQDATGQAPPIPQVGPLAKPRSLEQVGVPAELTRTVMPPDNPQTEEKIALGQKLFFDGHLSADGT